MASSSSSSSSPEFDPALLSYLPSEVQVTITQKCLKRLAFERIFEYQSLLIRKYGYRFVEELVIHPDYPFLRPYAFMDIADGWSWFWPREFLCFLWYFMHLYSIAVEVRPFLFLTFIARVKRDPYFNPNVTTFLRRFKSLKQWEVMLATEVARGGQTQVSELRTILVFHRPLCADGRIEEGMDISIRPHVFVYRSYPFSLYQHCYQHRNAVEEFQYFMCEQNGIPRRTLLPPGEGHEPWPAFPVEYCQKIVQDRLEWIQNQPFYPLPWPTSDKFNLFYRLQDHDFEETSEEENSEENPAEDPEEDSEGNESEGEVGSDASED